MAQSQFVPDSSAITRLCSVIRQTLADYKTVSAAQPTGTLVPTHEQLAALIATTFWASFRREEGRGVAPAVVFVAADACNHALRFHKPVAFSDVALAQLAPAFESPRTMAGVAPGSQDPLVLWGAVWDSLPPSVVVRVAEPGTVFVDFHPVRFVFSGPSVFEITWRLEDVFRLIKYGRDSREERFLAMGLREIATAMRRHGRGGTMLFVPRASAAWRGFVQSKYVIEPPFKGLLSAFEWKNWAPREASRREVGRDERVQILSAREAAYHHERFLAAARVVAQFTAVDGAVVVSDDLAVHGIGVKITAPDTPNAVLSFRYTAGGIREEVDVESVGGTRHQSAVRFVSALRHATALVASQDGRLSIFTWDEGHGLVVWHRDVDMLFV